MNDELKIKWTSTINLNIKSESINHKLSLVLKTKALGTVRAASYTGQCPYHQSTTCSSLHVEQRRIGVCSACLAKRCCTKYTWCSTTFSGLHSESCISKIIFCRLMSENLCEGPHIFTKQGIIWFKSGPDWEENVPNRWRIQTGLWSR